MTRLNFIVEGHTEESFVNNILCPYLSTCGIYSSAMLVKTSKNQKGGITNYQRAKNDITRWIKQEPKSYFTTMFDYYALPKDFPGMKKAQSVTELFDKIDIIEKEMMSDIKCSRFIPYIQLHEFEALLFSSISHIDNFMKLFKQDGNMSKLQNIRNKFTTPEHINDSKETSPSNRLQSIYPSYNKIYCGSSISTEIGIENMRKECRHFNGWLERMVNIVKLSIPVSR